MSASDRGEAIASPLHELKARPIGTITRQRASTLAVAGGTVSVQDELLAGGLTDKTPARAGRPSCSAIPATPISPMTAFYLTAPIEAINTSLPGYDSPERVRAHPYSAILPQDTTISLRQTETEAPKTAASARMRPHVRAAPSVPVLASHDPFTARFEIFPEKIQATTQPPIVKAARPVLQLKKVQPNAPKSTRGNNERDARDRRIELERQREKLRRMGVDLTPGMVDGQRPPKSGLPMSVSLRMSVARLMNRICKDGYNRRAWIRHEFERGGFTFDLVISQVILCTHIRRYVDSLTVTM